MTLAPEGLVHVRGRLSLSEQYAMLSTIGGLVNQAPYFTPTMPHTGRAFSISCTNFGALGWSSDMRRGYHYTPTHPTTGARWPAIPEALLDLWREHVGPCEPECCLVNRYAPRSKLGLHADADEVARGVPVVSLSLGASARFRIGGRHRDDPTRTFTLGPGDVLVLGGEARHCYHGIDSVAGPRINLTMRRVSDYR